MKRLRAHVQSIDHAKAMSPAVRAHLGLPSSAQMERDVWRDVVAPEFFRSFRRDVELMWWFERGSFKGHRRFYKNTDSEWEDEHLFHLDLSIFRWFVKKILEHIGEDMGYTMEVRDLQTALVRTGYGSKRFAPFVDWMARVMDEYATLWVESHGDGPVKKPDGREIHDLSVLMTIPERMKIDDIDEDFYPQPEESPVFTSSDEEGDEEGDW